jgi:hypothetical protein
MLTLVNFGAAGRNRTHDPLVRSQVLYPTELQPQRLAVYTDSFQPRSRFITNRRVRCVVLGLCQIGQHEPGLAAL